MSLLPLLPAWTPRPFSVQQVECLLSPLPEERLHPGVPQNEGVATARGPEHAVPSLQPQQDPKLGPNKGMHLTDLEGCPQRERAPLAGSPETPQVDVGQGGTRLLPPACSAKNMLGGSRQVEDRSEVRGTGRNVGYSTASGGTMVWGEEGKGGSRIFSNK